MAGLNRSLSLQTNTGGGGLFPSNPPTQQSQAGTLFGTAAQSSKPTFSFGTTATTSQPSTNLFAATTTTSQPTSNLFGGATTSSQPGSNLFGGTSGSTQQGGGWSFGGGQSSGSGGLFGASTTTAQPQQGSSLFGGAQTQAQSKPSLFGTINQPTTSTAGSSIFGASTAQTTKPSLFGMSAAQPQQQGSSIFGAPAQPQQQTVPGVKIDLSNIKPTTRFSELNEDLQNIIIQIDNFIQQQVKWATEIQESIPARGGAFETVPGDADYLSRRLELVQDALDSDAQDVKRVKDQLATDQGDASRCFNAIENIKLPAQYHYTGLAAASMRASGEEEGVGSTSDLIPYFEAKARDLDGQLKKYAANLAEVEEHMTTVEASAVEQFEKLVNRRSNPDEWNNNEIKDLAGTLMDFETAIFRVADKVGEVREEVVDLSLGGTGSSGTQNCGNRGGLGRF